MNRPLALLLLPALLLVGTSSISSIAQQPSAAPAQPAAKAKQTRSGQPAAKRKQPPFRWVNPLEEGKYPGVSHATFKSPSMQRDVGY